MPAGTIKVMKWSPKHEDAAQLVAEDRISDRKIAATIGIDASTLSVWKRHPMFQARVREIRVAACETIKKTGIGNIESRINTLDDLERRYKQVIHDRAERYQEQWDKAEEDRTEAGKAVKALANDKSGPTPFPVEEALTGLVVYREVPTKNGVIKEWVVDTAPASEIRALHQQAAKELGQWKDRAEVEVRDTSALESLKRRLLPSAGADSDSAVSGVAAGS